jgi:RNA polymerase sigma factor (TIGR02999 family)
LEEAETTGVLSRSVEITSLLKAWSGGDQRALERLAGYVYPELRLIARRYMKSEREGHTLQPTALLNEVYLRLVDITNVEFDERAQFFAMAAQMMRRILVDAARAHNARKRGALLPNVNIDKIAVQPVTPDRTLLAIDEALVAFCRVAPRQARGFRCENPNSAKDDGLSSSYTAIPNSFSTNVI